MSKFLISWQTTSKTIKDITINTSYSFNPKNKTGKYANIENFVLYDQELIQRILMKKYLIRYQKLVYIINSVTENDDSSDSDYMICLDEVEKLESILINKYQKYLNTKLYEYFLNNLVKTGKYLEASFINQKMFRGSMMGR